MGLADWEKVGRADPVYQACLAGSTVAGAGIGLAMGSMALPVLGSVAGWARGMAWGFAAGYLACPYLTPGIKRKFDLNEALSEAELTTAAEAMSQYANVNRAEDTLKLIAIVRPSKPAGNAPPMCDSPPDVAKSLLA